MATHTPGPWRRLKCIGGDSLTLTIGADNPYGSGPWEVAHAIGWGGDKWGDCEANADLIAAAPNLLAACEALIDAPHQEHFATRLNDEEMRAIDAIKAAISKAKGTP